MKLIDKFNHRDTNLIISGYPERDKSGENNYGIAWYTKETIEPIAKKYSTKFVVLSETNHDNTPKLHADNKILVLRVFNQRYHSLYPTILRWLMTFSNIRNVYVHSEFCTIGGVKNFILLIPFLGLIKLFNKNITYFAHNVVTDLTGIAPHLNLDRKSVGFSILNFGIKIYYQLLGYMCDRIVVMDEEMRRRLTDFVDETKIVYHPFWIKVKNYSLSKTKARKELEIKSGEFLVLYFGFVTWYKGADWVIDKLKNKRVKLILAGGPAYSLKDKIYYKRYYQKQLDKVKKCKNIRITGFVKEKDIEKYFAAADLVVFPYRGMIGSSGALTHAISNRKPFMVSDKMGSILLNSDFEEALCFAGLTKEEITFSLKRDLFFTTIEKIKDNKILEKLEKVSQYLARKRSIDNLLPPYHKSLFDENYNNRTISLRVATHELSALTVK